MKYIRYEKFLLFPQCYTIVQQIKIPLKPSAFFLQSTLLTTRTYPEKELFPFVSGDGEKVTLLYSFNFLTK